MAILETVLKGFAHNFSLNKDAVKALVQFDNMKGALTEPAALEIIEKSGAGLSNQQRKDLLTEFVRDPRVAAKLKDYSEVVKGGAELPVIEAFRNRLDATLQSVALADPLKQVETKVGADEWLKRKDSGPKPSDYTKELGVVEERAKPPTPVPAGIGKEASIKQARGSVTKQGNVASVDFRTLRRVKEKYDVGYSDLKAPTRGEELIKQGRQKVLDDQAEGEKRLREYKRESSIKQAGESITREGNVTGADFKALGEAKKVYSVDFSTLKKKE